MSRRREYRETGHEAFRAAHGEEAAAAMRASLPPREARLRAALDLLRAGHREDAERQWPRIVEEDAWREALG